MKHILDSVHGTIEIPKEYCDKIIDTAFFHDMFSVIGEKLPYCYMYVNLDQFEEKDRHNAIIAIINHLKDFLINALRDSWNL